MLIETDTIVIFVVFVLIGLGIFIVFAKSMRNEERDRRVKIIDQILISDSVNPLIANPLVLNPIEELIVWFLNIFSYLKMDFELALIIVALLFLLAMLLFLLFLYLYDDFLISNITTSTKNTSCLSCGNMSPTWTYFLGSGTPATSSPFSSSSGFFTWPILRFFCIGSHRKGQVEGLPLRNPSMIGSVRRPICLSIRFIKGPEELVFSSPSRNTAADSAVVIDILPFPRNRESLHSKGPYEWKGFSRRATT